jgi:hypothetical protein
MYARAYCVAWDLPSTATRSGWLRILLARGLLPLEPDRKTCRQRGQCVYPAAGAGRLVTQACAPHTRPLQMHTVPNISTRVPHRWLTRTQHVASLRGGGGHGIVTSTCLTLRLSHAVNQKPGTVLYSVSFQYTEPSAPQNSVCLLKVYPTCKVKVQLSP